MAKGLSGTDWGIHQSLSETADALEAKAEALYDQVVEAPDTVRKKVQEFAAMLDNIRTNLEAIAADMARYGQAGGKYLKDYQAGYNRMVRYYNMLAAGFYPHTEAQAGKATPPTSLPEIGVAPVVAVAVLAGVLAVSAAGVAWAVAAYSTAQWAQGQTQLQRDELKARVDAMNTGRTLPPSTIPPAKKPTDWVLPVVGGAVALVGLGFAIPMFMKRG